MGKVIKISDKVAKELDKLRHTGQSYDGALSEILDRTCDTCAWQEACNLIGNFLHSSEHKRPNYCSEYRKQVK